VLSVAKEGFLSGFNNIFWARRIFFIIMLPEQLNLLFVNRAKQRTTNNGNRSQVQGSTFSPPWCDL
jgi:hypothetical protein